MSDIAFEGRPISLGRRLTQAPWLRRVAVLVMLALLWEAAALYQNNPIMLPGFVETAGAFVEALREEQLLSAIFVSISVLLKGYAISIAIALVLVGLAVTNTFLRETLQTLTAMFNPLPAIALLPLALLWFGLGETSLLFVIAHSVIWPFALAALSGFESVPEAQRMVGRNYGLRGPSYVARILIPAALPSLISGLKIGWAFAWRTLIAAELIFGVTSGSSGLGWFIFRNRNELYTDKVFAGLAAVILIGLLVEIGVFRTLEKRTVRRWGMQR
jgi:NitT/TauT family transport system permease protein